MEELDRRSVIEPKDGRAAVAAIDKTLEGIRERIEKYSQEYDLLIARIGELDKLNKGLGEMREKLLSQKEWWLNELANGPPEPPEEPLRDAIDRLIEEDTRYTTAQLIERVDPAYFPDGITSNVKRKVFMCRRWALERRGLWKNSHEHNESGDSETDDPASGGTG